MGSRALQLDSERDQSLLENSAWEVSGWLYCLEWKENRKEKKVVIQQNKNSYVPLSRFMEERFQALWLNEWIMYLAKQPCFLCVCVDKNDQKA